jgi:hypothetical protein
MQTQACPGNCSHLALGRLLCHASINGPEEYADDTCAKGYSLDEGCDGEGHTPGPPMTAEEYREEAG